MSALSVCIRLPTRGWLTWLRYPSHITGHAHPNPYFAPTCNTVPLRSAQLGRTSVIYNPQSISQMVSW